MTGPEEAAAAPGPEALEALEEAPAGAIRLAEFNVPLGPGRVAIVALPLGVTAVEVLRLVGALPGIGAEASRMGGGPDGGGPRPTSRLVGLDGRRLG